MVKWTGGAERLGWCQTARAASNKKVANCQGAPSGEEGVIYEGKMTSVVDAPLNPNKQIMRPLRQVSGCNLVSVLLLLLLHNTYLLDSVLICIVILVTSSNNFPQTQKKNAKKT